MTASSDLTLTPEARSPGSRPSGPGATRPSPAGPGGQRWVQGEEAEEREGQKESMRPPDMRAGTCALSAPILLHINARLGR